jgi:hypothetical protein
LLKPVGIGLKSIQTITEEPDKLEVKSPLQRKQNKLPRQWPLNSVKSLGGITD